MRNESDRGGMAMDRNLIGDVAVITGGGSAAGIGAATGRLLAQHGCRIVLSDVNAATLDATVASLRTEGLDVTGIVGDVSELASMRALADQVFVEFGHVDIAFLNAGIGYAGSYFDDDIDAWHQAYGVNFFRVLHASRHSCPGWSPRARRATSWVPHRAREPSA
jgi:NAD(P)-dependent dehydrogenase (short-subunit alcohol dehydrogenase family)